MDVLVIGGRNFVGRHIVNSLLESRKFSVTLFNRGQTNPELFPGLEVLIGDRDSNYEALDGRQWDVIIDTCGYNPRPVDTLAKKLKGYKNHYIFISTCSVYNHHAQTGTLDEEAPIVDLDIDFEDPQVSSYGAGKFLCEKSIARHYKENFTAIRPGLIAGSFDSTYRLPYWVERIKAGGKVLAPGDPSAPVQFIDAGDLADWIVEIAINKVTGIFNACGPETPLTLGGLLESAKLLFESSAELVWVPESFLISQKVTPWVELPLWVYEKDRAFLKRNFSKAKKSGLTHSSIEQTLTDCSQWLQDHELPKEFRSQTLSREREQEILLAWEIENQ